MANGIVREQQDFDRFLQLPLKQRTVGAPNIPTPEQEALQEPLLEPKDVFDVGKTAITSFGKLALGAVQRSGAKKLLKRIFERPSPSSRSLYFRKQKRQVSRPGSEEMAKLFDANLNIEPEREIDVLFLGLNIEKEDVIQAREAIKFATRKALDKKGFGEKIRVFRGGRLPADPKRPVPVTTNKNIAQEFADEAGGPLQSFTVRKEDVLADIQALQRGEGFLEDELLVRAKDLIQSE